MTDTACVNRGGDWSASGDAGAVVQSAHDESQEPGLRSWPPKSHSSGAPVLGITAYSVVSRICGFWFPKIFNYINSANVTLLHGYFAAVAAVHKLN